MIWPSVLVTFCLGASWRGSVGRRPPMATSEASGPQGGWVGRCIPMGTGQASGLKSGSVGRWHPDTGKAAGWSVCVHPEAQNSQSSEVCERLSDARAAPEGWCVYCLPAPALLAMTEYVPPSAIRWAVINF